MRNLPNPPRQYSKRQTRAQEMEKFLDEGLEPTYHFSIFMVEDIKVNIDTCLHHLFPMLKKGQHAFFMVVDILGSPYTIILVFLRAYKT